MRTFGPIQKPEAIWVLGGSQKIYEWERHVALAERYLDDWAKQLGQPELAMNLTGKEFRRLDTVCRRVWRTSQITRATSSRAAGPRPKRSRMPAKGAMT